MSEVQALCDFVLVMKNGEIVVAKEMSDSRTQFVKLKNQRLVLKGSDIERAEMILKDNANTCT